MKKRVQDNRIVCDMGRTRILFAVSGDDLDSEGPQLKSWATREFKGDRPLASAVQKFLRSRKIDPANYSISLSLPIAIIGDEAIINNVGDEAAPVSWRITKQEIRDLGFQGVLFANDMVSASLAIPHFVQELWIDPISGGTPASGYPIALIGVRTGLGAMALVQSWGSNAEWIPVQAEGGYVGLSPDNEIEHQLMHIIRKEIEQIKGRVSLTVTAQDILAGHGVPRLYRAVCEMSDALPVASVTSAKALSLLASQEHEDEIDNDTAKKNVEVAKLTIEYWCGFFGSFARNIAMVYGASGGIYLLGRLPQDFLSLKKGNMRYREAFRRNFQGEGPLGYLQRIPIMLVTHPNPYLKGIARVDATREVGS